MSNATIIVSDVFEAETSDQRTIEELETTLSHPELVPTALSYIKNLELYFPLHSSGRLAMEIIRREATRDTKSLNTFVHAAEEWVSQWQSMEHPNLMRYGIVWHLDVVGPTTLPDWVQAHPEANALDLLGQVAAGLDYIHSFGLFHGDIRGLNILVDEQGVPKIMDTAQYLIVGHSSLTSQNKSNSCRWSAPELLYPPGSDNDNDSLLPNSPPYTQESDIYSLGMTILEVLTGKLPFHKTKQAAAVVPKVFRGDRPDRPSSNVISDGLWTLLEGCWDREPSMRPSAKQVQTSITTLQGRISVP